MNGLDLKMGAVSSPALPAMASRAATTTQSSQAGTSAADDGKKSKMAQAAKQFEAVFMRQMISSMRSATLSEDILGSSASEQFRDMSDSKLADAMAGKGTLGIAEMLLQQFNRKDSDNAAVNKAVQASQLPAPTAAVEGNSL